MVNLRHNNPNLRHNRLSLRHKRTTMRHRNPDLRHLSGIGAAEPFQQILNLATEDGWTAVYDPTNPNTRTLRASGGSQFVAAIADGLGNLPDAAQNTEADQPELIVGHFGKLDSIRSAVSEFLITTVFTDIPQPLTIMAVGESTVTTLDRALMGNNDDGALGASLRINDGIFDPFRWRYRRNCADG